MKEELNILLIMPAEKQRKILSFIEQNPVDLVVLPESSIRAKDENEAIKIIKSWNLGVPTLCGVSLENRNNANTPWLEWAVYYNPNPKKDETTIKHYCKHSSATSIAFNLPDYKKIQKDLFTPIELKGYKIQVNICHDIFFPLINSKLEKNEMDILINLTGGNVVLAKWYNIFCARSLEIKSYIFCTMHYLNSGSNDSDSFGYHNGKKMLPIKKVGDHKKGITEFSLFRVEPNPKIDKSFAKRQEPSPKEYDDFTISTASDQKADLVLKEQNNQLLLSENTNGNFVNSLNQWYLCKKNDFGICVLEYTKLFDREAIYSLDYSNTPNIEHFIIIYYSSVDVNIEETLALLKLRAIENRIGAMIYAPNFKCLIKTNRYKNIQMFNPKNHIIGVNLEFLGGIFSVFNGSGLGIPAYNAIDYLDLSNKTMSLKKNWR